MGRSKIPSIQQEVIVPSLKTNYKLIKIDVRADMHSHITDEGIITTRLFIIIKNIGVFRI